MIDFIKLGPIRGEWCVAAYAGHSQGIPEVFYRSRDEASVDEVHMALPLAYTYGQEAALDCGWPNKARTKGAWVDLPTDYQPVEDGQMPTCVVLRHPRMSIKDARFFFDSVVEATEAQRALRRAFSLGADNWNNRRALRGAN
jgi:hypothetical protein